MKKNNAGPQFLRFSKPLIEVIRENGGSGIPSRLTDLVIKKCGITEDQEREPTKNGESRVRNQIAWARFYLTKAGILDGTKRGTWAFTNQGLDLNLDTFNVLSMFKDVQSKWRTNSSGGDPDDVDVDSEIVEEDHKPKALAMVKTMSPSGFEKFVKRLLTESGFESVEVVGKSGDGGIDGHGILKINALTSMKVIFQCKRYKDSVGPSIIRDFRGAMAGRTDKGIVLTTGYFTSEAKREATRDGVSPIELVDGEAIVRIMEKYELGLTPKTIYELDDEFFVAFDGGSGANKSLSGSP